MHCDQLVQVQQVSGQEGRDRMCRPGLRTSFRCSWPASTCDVRAATSRPGEYCPFGRGIDRNALQTDCLRGVIVVVDIPESIFDSAWVTTSV
jgi:hypothetical protein